jgi:hypothetical protein
MKKYQKVYISSRIKLIFSGIMKQRIFTSEEANYILPKVISTFHRIFYLNERVKSLTRSVEDLIDIWGEDIFDEDNQDKPQYKELLRKRKKMTRELRRLVDTLQKMGCLVRDIDTGIVDFYSEIDGSIVLLCWKYGEDTIKSWHPINSGFSNRKTLSVAEKTKTLQ